VSTTRARGQLTLPVDADHDHIQGPADAPVTLLEYGDYECPYCGAAYPIIKAIQAELGEQLRFVYRNFPITSSHPHAAQAAEAAEAAAAQGHFWEMHDQLFEHQRELRLEHLRAYARAIGLDLKRFDYELADNVYTEKVRDEFMGGVRSGVNGTPTYFINGVRYDGSHDMQALLTALRSAIEGVR